MDVLEQIKQALQDGKDAVHSEYCGYRCGERCQQLDAAQTALRGLEWKPIEEMESLGQEVLVGKWHKGLWVYERTFDSHKQFTAKIGYTHFCRPILPTPPKREDSCKS